MVVKSTLEETRKNLRKYASAKKAKDLQWFFKAGPGEYAEGDVFIGVVVPSIRKVARQSGSVALKDVFRLLKADIHEERMLALCILAHRFTEGDAALRQQIFQEYLKHSAYINNWDLVDLSAPRIVGVYLKEKNRDLLYGLARSQVLWKRRIAIVSTLVFIRDNEFKDTLRLSELLLSDEHDLIHKAVGWMLREVGKRDANVLRSFLNKFYGRMPRTMLRYAIERFAEKERQKYLKAKTKTGLNKEN